MTSARTLLRRCALPLLLVGLAGCGSKGPRVVEVTGTLTHQGKPVPNTLMHFLPENGRQSWAQTDAEGRFKINYDRHQDGAIEGKHKVWLEYRGGSQAEQEAAMLGKAMPIPKDFQALLQRYNYNNSRLVVEISRDRKDITIELE